jgi:hypothetical protein
MLLDQHACLQFCNAVCHIWSALHHVPARCFGYGCLQRARGPPECTRDCNMSKLFGIPALTHQAAICRWSPAHVERWARWQGCSSLWLLCGQARCRASCCTEGQATCSTSHLQQVGADAAATWSPASKQQIPSCFELQVVNVAAREQLGRLWQCSARKVEAHACETTHVPLLACVSVPRCYSEALVQQCLIVPVSCQGHKTHCESIYPSQHFGS